MRVLNFTDLRMSVKVTVDTKRFVFVLVFMTCLSETDLSRVPQVNLRLTM